MAISALVQVPALAGPTADQILAQSLYDQIYPCWDGIADLGDPSRLRVSVQIVIRADGALSRPPIVLIPETIDQTDTAMALAVERALKAVEGCAPYDIPEARAPLPVNINLGPMPPGPTLS